MKKSYSKDVQLLMKINMISKEVMTEIKDRITFCTNNAKISTTHGKQV